MNKPVEIARKHANTNSNSRACFNDAVRADAAGNEIAARRWACRTIAHAVGVFHPDFKEASGGVAPSCVC